MDQILNVLTEVVVQFHSVQTVLLLVEDVQQSMDAQWDKLVWKDFVVHSQDVQMESLLLEFARELWIVGESALIATTELVVHFHRAQTILHPLKDVLLDVRIVVQLVRLV